MSTNNIDRRVSVLGLGDLGSALARSLIKQGWNVTVWNRSVAKAQLLAAEGATVAMSGDECVAKSPVTIACLTDSGVLANMLAETINAESAAGRVLVNFSSGTFPTIEQCEQRAGQVGFASYLHAAIFATPSSVGHPDTPSYYGGNKQTYDSLKPVLEAFGRPIYLGNEPATARFQEILMGGCFYGFATGFLQTMATLRFSRYYVPGAAQRLMSEMVIPLLTHSFPATFGDLAKQVDDRDYISRGDGARLGLLRSMVEDRVEIDRGLGLANIASRPMMEMIRARLANGGSVEEEMSSLIEVIADPDLCGK